MMRVVRVPTPQEEQLRAQRRHLDQLISMRKRLAAQGRALVLSQGYGMMQGAWWRPIAYRKWGPLLPEWIRTELEVWQASLRLLDNQIAQRKKELIQSNKEALPKGFGAQTMVQMDREIGDYFRFKNRRKIACFGAFIPQEHSTGSDQRLGSITKVGSPRIQRLITEMVWRLPLFQPSYPPIDPLCNGESFFAAKIKCSRKSGRGGGASITNRHLENAHWSDHDSRTWPDPKPSTSLGKKPAGGSERSAALKCQSG
jgi:hypothetical protein